MSIPKYSVVIPLKNEEDNIEELILELEPVMESLQEPWELLCIDDGSTDNTLEKLLSLCKTKPYLRTIKFKQNFGQSSAFDAGFRKAKGEFIITLDGDRQNDPQDIPKLTSYTNRFDLICGLRANRQDTTIKKLTSRLANSVRSSFCGDGIQDTGCSLKIYRKACLDKIKMFDGMHRFLPALFRNEGFRIVEVPVNHRSRTKGQTKYNFLNRSFNTISDMFAVRWMKKRGLKYVIDQEFNG